MSETDPRLPGAEVVPFGKYKGEPVEVLIADREYTEWLAGQPWFRQRYATIYQLVVNYGGQPEDSPEHNEMQARFLDPAWGLALFSLVADTEDYGHHTATVENLTASFEVDGWDVVVRVDWWGRLYIECKPDLGDDYPNVLRQVKRYEKGYSGGSAVVLVRRHRFEHVTWDQVSAIFATAHVRLVAEGSIMPAAPELPGPGLLDDRPREG